MLIYSHPTVQSFNCGSENDFWRISIYSTSGFHSLCPSPPDS